MRKPHDELEAVDAQDWVTKNCPNVQSRESFDTQLSMEIVAKRVLSGETDYNGAKVSKMEALVQKKYEHDMENPRDIRLADYAKVLGEGKTQVEAGPSMKSLFTSMGAVRKPDAEEIKAEDAE